MRGIGSHHCEAHPIPFFGPTPRLNSLATKTIVSGPLWRGRRLRPTSRCRIVVLRELVRARMRPRISRFAHPPSWQIRAPFARNPGRPRRLAKRSTMANRRPHAITIAELPAGRHDRDEDMLQALVTAGALVALADGELAP